MSTRRDRTQRRAGERLIDDWRRALVALDAEFAGLERATDDLRDRLADTPDRDEVAAIEAELAAIGCRIAALRQRQEDLTARYLAKWERLSGEPLPTMASAISPETSR